MSKFKECTSVKKLVRNGIKVCLGLFLNAAYCSGDFTGMEDIDCLLDNGKSAFMKNLTNSDTKGLLLNFQHQGCKGTPGPTTEQSLMLKCCSAISSSASSETGNGPSLDMSESCSNLNLLSIIQTICRELKKNEGRYHEEFKSLLKSEHVKAILGGLNYVDFHKTMLAIIYQNAFIIIRQVESEIGIENALAEEYFRNTTKCLF